MIGGEAGAFPGEGRPQSAAIIGRRAPSHPRHPAPLPAARLWPGAPGSRATGSSPPTPLPSGKQAHSTSAKPSRPSGLLNTRANSTMSRSRCWSRPRLWQGHTVPIRVQFLMGELLKIPRLHPSRSLVLGVCPRAADRSSEAPRPRALPTACAGGERATEIRLRGAWIALGNKGIPVETG